MRCVLTLLLAGPAVSRAAPWPIACTEQAAGTRIPDAHFPYPLSHAKIVRLDPDGKRTVLVDPGPDKAAWDHCVSLDGQWLYYAQTHNLERGPLAWPNRPWGGSDIWRLNLETGFREQITHQGAAPYAGRDRHWSFGVWNMGPCPLHDRLIFTSDREIPGQHQLWSCDLDGKNVEKIGYLNVQSALHPVRLSNGRILFSTNEGQGLRISICWGLWTCLPDGRDFEPFFSAYWAATILHWHAEAANKHVVSAAYYASNNDGFGLLFAAPLDFPGYEHRTTFPATRDDAISRLFLPKGGYELSPWTVPWDTAAPLGKDGVTRVGKLSHPAACPDPAQILVTYSPGPANRLERPTSQPPLAAGIYLCPTGKPTAGPEELVKVIDDPAVHEWQAQALVPYSAIFGSAPFGALPKQEEWLPNAGSEHLPAGTPYALIGSSSLYVRETDSFINKLPFRPISLQGGNEQPFDNAEIAKIRILTMEWPTDDNGEHQHDTGLAGDERLRILGEVDVRRFDAQGNRIKDPAGNPDTSFLAKIRADEPFTFQLIDKDGQALTTAQTWHHLRPGERKHDCRGCHAHTAPEIRFDFEASWAAKNPPVDLTQSPGRLVELHRDVMPILGNHKLDPVEAGKQVRIFDSRHSLLIKALERAKATPEEIRTVAEWVDTGCLSDTGDGFRDDTKPTLFIHSPRRKAAAGARIIVSVADAALDAASLSVRLNGQPVALVSSGESGIWNGPELTASGELTVGVKDRQGNEARQVRKFEIAASPPPPPTSRAPRAVYLGRDSDNVGPGRSGTPDGVLDHHIKVTGLGAGGNRLIVTSDNGAFKYSNEAEIPLALMRPVLPGSPTGLADIWFNPVGGNEGLTDWVVHVRYADGSEDHIPTTLPDSGGSAEAAKLKAAIQRARAELEAALAP